MATSQVRVAIRIRPLSSREHSASASSILTATSNTVSLSNRTFTYDSVYNNISQSELYEDVGSLLDGFLNGYNATVLAYGQTGSGKTYSMGSEAHSTHEESGEDDGLIPRFMNDIFNELERRKQSATSSEKLVDFTVEATFLEVYGEDIHDLLDEDRKSLPIREDSNGEVKVVGLRVNKVCSNVEAMEVLNTGTMNRTTASTLMNTTSSRSHAVFTVNLKQILRADDGVDVVTTSRFTFVDLAGSERMKKTGASGERMMEGIRINEGLLALGNVINALADEERLAKGEKVHVPYRQSKLTRLLQDALGGNSQTFFLACVSPSDTNASETLSTLQYAHRARNIKNSPTKNVDATVLELQNLRALTNVLKCELIKKSFEPVNHESARAIGEVDDKLLQRADVLAYMNAIDEKVAEIIGCNVDTAYPVSVSTLSKPKARSRSTQPSRSRTSTYSSQSERTTANGHGVIEGTSKDDPIDTVIYDVNPDEDMKLVDKLLELQHREEQFSNDQKHGNEELETMQGEIEAQEECLNKLRENLIMYHNIKVKYEKLMCEVHSLESEKQALADALEKVQLDPTKGCSKAIKRKLQDVEMSLARARSETRRQQQQIRHAEQETQKCKVLERKIQDLKHAKVNLIKKQKEEAAKHKEYNNQKIREINSLKRKEKTSEKTISKIQGENQKFRSNLERSRAQNERLSEKLKQTEAHLMRLLAERRNNMARHTLSRRSKIHVTNMHDFEGSDKFAPASSEEVNSLKFLLEKSVGDRVNLLVQMKAYEAKVVEHGKLLQNMATEMKVINQKQGQKSNESIQEHEDNVHEYQLKLELVENDLEKLREKFPRVEEYYFEEDQTKKQRETLPALKIISKIDAPVLRTLFWEFLETHIDSEYQRKSLKGQLAQKESTLHSFEKELEVQHAKVEALSKSLDQYYHRALNDADNGTVNKLKMSITAANSKIDLCLHEKALLLSELDEAQKALKISQMEHSQAMDRLALACANQNLTQSNEETSRMLRELQEIWADVGLTMNERQTVRERLQNCVEDACSSMLLEASKMRDSKRQEVERLSSKLQNMRAHLGTNETTENESSLQNQSVEDQLKTLNCCIHEIRHEYENSSSRFKSLLDAAKALTSDLDLDESSFSQNLQVLIKDGQSSSTEPILSASFLDTCENDIKRLRLLKSEKLLSTAEMCNRMRSLMREMDVNVMDMHSLVLYCIKRRSDRPSWWDGRVFDKVLTALSKQGSEQSASETFSKHLKLVVNTLEDIAHGRRLLSCALKRVVEESHEVILATAEGCEMDVKDLYQNLQAALVSLPSLSKQHVDGCIDEMKMFVTAAEAISQSEIETLTVLWEGLGVSSGIRGRFWSKLEEAVSKMKCQTNSPFDCVLNECNSDVEEWVLKAVTEATKVQRLLGVRVYKLKSVHEEVERLKKKQSAKNRIMSLNGELKLLSAKLTDFEENAGNRYKLTNKRINSSTLLEEERFRKHMQAKFASKLELLGELLNDWEISEGKINDTDMLSEVVKDMLKNSHRLDAWMSEKTRFMHLRTTQSKKRGIENASSSTRPSSRRGMSTTQTVAPSSGKARLASKSTIDPIPSNCPTPAEAQYHKTPLTGTSNNSQQNALRLPKKSPTITVEIPEALPNPFQNLLSDTPVSKENAAQF